MHILTILTKRSVREVLKDKKFLKFYSSKNFNPGEMIEIIDGNKKSPAIILKSEPASKYKEEVRMGQLKIKKLTLSKSGPRAGGKIIDSFDLSEIKKFLKNPLLAQESQNKNIKAFFPKIIKKNTDKKNINTVKNRGISDISSILSSKIIQKEKSYHTPMQEMVDTIRNYFGEKARYGYGSFSYYIGMFKQVPERDIWQFFGEAKQSKKPLFQQKKIFWYKMGKYIKKKRENGKKDEN